MLTELELAEISRRTLGHYDDNAQGFWQGTRGHDVSQNIEALLGALELDSARILDFGCGPGRDLAVFKALGHQPVGLDGSAAFCELARDFSGCEVLHQDFLALELPTERFDGVFANASLFHVPSQELPRVLRQLRGCLAPRGVLFCSNPRGPNVEGWNGHRYGAYHDLVTWRRFLGEAGFEELRHYYRPPGKPRDQQPWLASCWRKLAEAGR
jgi:SAM-dependent methyltransferase